MRLSSTIGHVIEIYSIFQSNPAIPADAILRRFLMERKYLGARDRRTIADSYFSTIKHWRRIESRIFASFPDKEILPARMVAGLMLLRGSEQPVIISSLKERNVDLDPKSVAAFCDDEAERVRLEKLAYIERLAILHSFPSWLAIRLGVEYGMDAVEPLFASQNEEAPTSLRANTLLTDRDKLAESLLEERCETVPSEVAPDGLRLNKRYNVFSLTPFKRGEFEVQDEASQLVAPFANIRSKSIKVLDACAGAGGKSLHFAALMKNKGEIFSTDVDSRKLDALSERAARSTAQNIRVVKPENKARMLGEDKKEWFDIVLLDVPCTGSGTLRRNPGIKWLLTEQMLSELLEKQRKILDENISFVKPGGTLLYSTCSLLKEEGEIQMERFIEQHPEFTLEETMRTRPDIEGCDGFFAARLKKRAP